MIFYLLESCPTELYLQRLFHKRYAKYWHEIGVELNVHSSVLENVRENYATHHNKSEECCKSMIEEWLKVDSSATWEKLIKAIDITQANPTFCYKS